MSIKTKYSDNEEERKTQADIVLRSVISVNKFKHLFPNSDGMDAVDELVRLKCAQAGVPSPMFIDDEED